MKNIILQKLLLCLIKWCVVSIFLIAGNVFAATEVTTQSGKNSLRVMIALKNYDVEKYHVAINGNIVAITFDIKEDLDVSKTRDSLYPHAKDISFSNNTLSITLNDFKYTSRKFISDKFIGIDLIRDSKIKEPKYSDKNQDPKLQKKEEKTAKIIPDAPKTGEKVKNDNVKDDSSKIIDKLINNVINDKIDLVDLRAELQQLILDGSDQAREEELRKLIEKATGGKIVYISDEDVGPNFLVAANSDVKPDIKKINKRMIKTIEVTPQTIEAKNSFQIKIKWPEFVGAASFIRAGRLWLVFDFPAKIHWQPIDNNYLTLESSFIKDGFSISIFQVNNKNSIAKIWDNNKEILLFIGDKKYDNFGYKRKEKQQSLANDEVVFFPNDYVQDPLSITDEYVGDNITIVPTVANAYDQNIKITYPSFSLLPSIQGLLFETYNDDVSYKRVDGGVEANEVSLDPENIIVKKKIEKIEKSSRGFYKFDDWKGASDPNYYKNITNIYEYLTYSSPEKKSKHRLDLLKFYFANGLLPETEAVIKYIKVVDPELYDNVEVQAIFAATDFLQGNFGDARFRYMEIEKIADIPSYHKRELKFWLDAVNSAMEDNRGENYYVLKNDAGFFNTYPAKLKNYFRMLNINQLIDKENYIYAKEILKKIDILALSDKEKNTIKIYQAKIEDAEGQMGKALALYSQVMADPLDPMNRSKATYEKVKLAVDSNKMSKKDAIEQLNKVTFAWRGDAVEANVLELLGQYNIDEGNYAQGLRLWRTIVSSAVDNGRAVMVASNMSKVFSQIIVDPKFSDMDAAALYYEFRELTPIGKIGDDIISNVEDRLIRLDLLIQASALIRYKLENRLIGVEKEPYINKLAKVYLNAGKPDDALDVLDSSVNLDMLTMELLSERIYIKVKSLIALKKYDDALEYLNDKEGVLIDALKAEIYWESKNWEGLKSILRPIVRNYNKNNNPLSAHEAEKILQLAVTYSMLQEKQSIITLQSDFSARIKDKDITAALDYLVNTTRIINPQNLEASLGIKETQKFLKELDQNQQNVQNKQKSQ
jgi:hypothetical protein